MISIIRGKCFGRTGTVTHRNSIYLFSRFEFNPSTVLEHPPVEDYIHINDGSETLPIQLHRMPKESVTHAYRNVLANTSRNPQQR